MSKRKLLSFSFLVFIFCSFMGSITYLFSLTHAIILICVFATIAASAYALHILIDE